MPLYDVIVTADVTESAVIRVEGDSIRDASYKALDEARLNGPKYDWQRDEGNSWQPYLGDEDGATLVDEDDEPEDPPCPINRRPQSTCPAGCDHGERPDVPFAKVKEIADSYRALRELELKKFSTMALMIRACLQRLDRKPTGFERTEDLRRNRAEREQALKGLRDLATMLEAQGVRDPDTIEQRT